MPIRGWGGSVLLSEASARSTPRAFQPMTTLQAHTRQHAHHSIATAASIPLSITGSSSPCRSARATSIRETPAEEMSREITTTHAQHHASTLPPGILTLPLRTFLILASFGSEGRRAAFTCSGVAPAGFGAILLQNKTVEPRERCWGSLAACFVCLLAWILRFSI